MDYSPKDNKNDTIVDSRLTILDLVAHPCGRPKKLFVLREPRALAI
jgi:hypothetical protein